MGMLEDAADRSGQLVQLPAEVGGRAFVLRPGDSLVILFEGDHTDIEMGRVAEMLKEALPNVDAVAINSSEVRIAVLHRDEEDSR